MIIGSHVATSGGLKAAVNNGLAIGAEALQIFPSAPVQWKIRGWSDEECAEFKKTWPEHFKQIVFHGIYLTNLAGSGENLEKTRLALIETVKLASKIGAAGTIFHPGSYLGGQIVAKEQVAQIINDVLAETPDDTKLIFENSAGSTMGGKIEDLVFLLGAAKDRSQVGICLDTCHAFAAGYDISTRDGYENYVAEIDEKIGLENVFAWHLNDSKFGLSEKRDRHENIGQGKIGKEAFGFILNDQRWTDLVGYIEVPGFDDHGPDKENIDILKSLRK